MKEDAFVSALIEKLNQLKRDREVRDTLADALTKFKAYRSKLWPKKENSTIKTEDDKKVEVIPKIHQTTNKSEKIENLQRYPQTIQAEKKKKIRSDKRHLASHNKITLASARFSTSKSLYEPVSTNKNDAGITIVGYCISGNPVPYRTKVRGKNITLGHFKTLLNRKGYYRYFFKKYCNEFGTDIVFEEVTDEEELVPLWEEKIFAMVEKVEELTV